MNHSFPGDDNSRSKSPGTRDDRSLEESNWVDDDPNLESISKPKTSVADPFKKSPLKNSHTLVMVETAFLASTASLIWLINYYFPLGPILKIFFPIPVALAYLRWSNRASWMTTLVSVLLLTVLMGPPRSIIYLIPYGLMGVQLGACWRRGAHWWFSIFTGALIGTSGFFFRFWLFSILLGEDLWLYVITQVTEIVDWVFLRLGLLAQPSVLLIQIIAVLMIFLNDLIYLFAVHLVALLVLDRLGNPIPRPPEWVQVLLDYE
ncbi:putative membrane protein [Pleurocapsa sp. PCC 7327]|uniref:DUF2232 domain-containing protein n=1 Tax=Pleurocapsa sp. PCC 7327 TaxID=118163 RepID=UPI00029FF951|nr:DUF2232 domain-containing protein [Pleurocapsa sp. PCC 7327]AFY79427.1 putative membrane protein [Pleurocapsa sp. PCC 7327]